MQWIQRIEEESFLDSSLEIKFPAFKLFCSKSTSNSHNNLKPRFKIKHCAVFDVTVDEVFCRTIKSKSVGLSSVKMCITTHLH